MVISSFYVFVNIDGKWRSMETAIKVITNEENAKKNHRDETEVV